MSILDAIGQLDRVPFQDVHVPDLGMVVWFQADIQVEKLDDSYHFEVLQIYTQHDGGEGDDSFKPALKNTATQVALEFELRTFLTSDPDINEQLCEAADREGLSHWIREAA